MTSRSALSRRRVPCPHRRFGYDATGAEPYPMLTVHVWANADLPADCTLSFSLNSYKTEGPDWPSTGTQALYDHETITLDAGHPSGTLTCSNPLCFGQTDFYTGTIRFDGVDGPLPSYPDNVVPQPLLAWSNGGSACNGLTGRSATPDLSAPIDAPVARPEHDPPVLSTGNPPVLAPEPPVAFARPAGRDPAAQPRPEREPGPVAGALAGRHGSAGPHGHVHACPTDSSAPTDTPGAHRHIVARRPRGAERPGQGAASWTPGARPILRGEGSGERGERGAGSGERGAGSGERGAGSAPSVSTRSPQRRSS